MQQYGVCAPPLSVSLPVGLPVCPCLSLSLSSHAAVLFTFAINVRLQVGYLVYLSDMQWLKQAQEP